MSAILRASLLTILLLGPAVHEVDAASATCRQLKASLTSGGTAGKAARAYDRAIKAQLAAIEETERRMRSPSCAAAGRARPECDALAAAMPEMKANLRALRGRRAGMGGSIGRAALQARLRAGGCGEAAAKPLPVKSTASPLPVSVPPKGVQPLQPLRFPKPTGAESVCVRRCDGYLFPMMPTRAPVDDQLNCQAACPEAEMEVFYSRDGMKDAAMSSAATGRPYGELPTAFQFRDPGLPRAPGCGCNRTATKTVPSREVARKATIATPVPASPPSEPAARRVRVVAPAFLPDPAGAIDLKAPGPSAGL